MTPSGNIPLESGFLSYAQQDRVIGQHMDVVDDVGGSGADARTEGWVVVHPDGKAEVTSEFFKGYKVPESIMNQLVQLAQWGLGTPLRQLRENHFGVRLTADQA